MVTPRAARYVRRRQFEVGHAAGRAWSKSFTTRALADSYRAELVRAARQGRELGAATGEPATCTEPGLPAVTWLDHAFSCLAFRS